MNKLLKNSIIIVEGQDRVGKDTLIDYIKSEFYETQFLEIKSTRLKTMDNLSNKYFRWSRLYYLNLLRMIKNISNINDSHLILNRSWISEIVYSKIYRQTNQAILFNYEKSVIEKISKHTNVILILLTDDKTNLLKREDGDSVNLHGKRFIDMEKKLFKEAFNKSSIPNKIFINCSGKTTEQIKTTVIKSIRGLLWK